MLCIGSLFNPFTCINSPFLPCQAIDSTPITMLPEELMVHIFSFLSATALATAQRVCKHWRKIAEEDSLWKRHHQRHFGCKPLKRIFSREAPYSFKKSYLIYCKNEGEYIRFKKMLTFSPDERMDFEHPLLEHYCSIK